MSLIRRVPWTVQPQYAAKVKKKYRPLYGLQPGGFGILDTSGQPLTSGAGASSDVSSVGRVFRGTDDANGYLRNTAVSANYPLSLVFRGTVNGTGVRVPTALATSTDKTCRIYCNGGPIAAQHIGGTTSGTATTSGNISAVGKPFTAVAVFGSATDVRIYGAGSAGRGSASASTNIGSLVALDRLSYGQYYGGAVQYAWGGDIALAHWLNVLLTAAEAWALVDNPWQIFESPSIDIWVPSAGGGPTYTLSALTTSFALSGTATSLAFNRALAAVSGSFALSGTAAALKFNRSLTAGSGSFLLSGTNASLKFNRVLSASSGVFLLTGTDSTLIYSGAGGPTYTLDVTNGNFALTGTNVTFNRNRVIQLGNGSFTLNGTNATLTYSGAPPPAGAILYLDLLSGKVLLLKQL